MKIYILVGTRPNFVKITQFKRSAAKLYPQLKISVIHTGQHYDEKMADIFFKQFDLQPDHYLNISPVSPNRQIAEIMVGLEKLVEKIGKPDLFLVVGDVNSTLAGALFANKCGIKLGHIEAGLRSFDKSMPEEQNRIIADQLADLHFVTEQSGEKNLCNEMRNPSGIHLVGNTMIDTLVAYQSEIEKSLILDQLKVQENRFVLMTMHRPTTVDSKPAFEKLLELIDYISQKYKIVFPIHPRTIRRAEEFKLKNRIFSNQNLICTEPLDYFAFQKLVRVCAFILTDSGGIQEEATFVQKPCLTLRSATERPVTVDEGTNTLLDFDSNAVKEHILQIENGSYKTGHIPKYWDGRATERILKIISDKG
ncbi:MAG: UDP-N-acetylglucosamine 2-epimerase (non-hydrolyzing) [Bacteroidota bacterium]